MSSYAFDPRPGALLLAAEVEAWIADAPDDDPAIRGLRSSIADVRRLALAPQLDLHTLRTIGIPAGPKPKTVILATG